MSDHFVTVASFAFMPEAQMAKNLLESEGISAFLAGEMTANTLNITACEAHLQVREEDAQRAVRLLASVSAQASLDHDWETQAESGVWTCPLCGTAVRLGNDVCPACQTTNPGITTDRRDTWTDPRRAAHEAEIVKNDQIQAGAPRAARPPAVEEDADLAPKAGCAMLLFALILPPLWLLCR